jgi:uncharacterized protein (DUF924 family)
MERSGSSRGEPAWVGEVIDFWLVETSAEKRFAKDADLDAEIERRFAKLHADISERPLASDSMTAREALATVIVLDQFSRNMFRGSARAFASDTAALSLAKAVVERGLDAEVDPAGRLFLYLPFEHSESMADQDRAVALIATLGDAKLDAYAVAHRDIIARFGRFPHRNDALGRVSTPEEIAFLAQPGSSF